MCLYNSQHLIGSRDSVRHISLCISYFSHAIFHTLYMCDNVIIIHVFEHVRISYLKYNVTSSTYPSCVQYNNSRHLIGPRDSVHHISLCVAYFSHAIFHTLYMCDNVTIAPVYEHVRLPQYLMWPVLRTLHVYSTMNENKTWNRINLQML